jgi:hypothetical protein
MNGSSVADGGEEAWREGGKEKRRGEVIDGIITTLHISLSRTVGFGGFLLFY